jgi:HD-like signal output (HDOD) protein
MLEIDQHVISDIRRSFSIPAQPRLLLKLQQLINHSDPDINEVAELISRDAAISSIIIKTVNSPIYGLARSMSDIQKAFRYIGIKGIMSLVSSILIRQSFKQPECSIALEEFWINASNIANTNVIIGKSLKKAVSIDKLFTLGLFHDCGIPVMAMKYPDYSDTYQQAMNTPSISLTAIEENIYQINHATLGYYVASSWRLPRDICQLILSHHDRNYLLTKGNRLQQFYFAILKMAENIVHNNLHFKDTTDWAYLSDHIFTVLDLNEDHYQDLLEDSVEAQLT